MARVEGFEPPTIWFVARYSIQLSYTRTITKMAVREGFEPSIGLQTLYSLSRGAPSASRPSHRFRGAHINDSENLVKPFLEKRQTFWLFTYFLIDIRALFNQTLSFDYFSCRLKPFFAYSLGSINESFITIR